MSDPSGDPATLGPTHSPRPSRRTSRALLAASGVALAVSLFLPWFDGVSGWEHWAWADVVLVVLAADLVAAAFTPPLVVHRVIVAVLCALGVAVMLGHGFEPRVDFEGPITTVRTGAYLCLGALAVGFVAALAPWPRRFGRLLLLLAAGGIVAALLSVWGDELMIEPLENLGGRSELVHLHDNGFQRWEVLDHALLALAAALVALAVLSLARGEAMWRGRPARLLGAAAFAGCVLAAACVLVADDTAPWPEGFPFAWALPMGTLFAVLATFAGAAGLVLLRPRGRSGRAG